MTERARILAIDYGAHRIGVAVSDELQIIASGLPTLPNTGHLVQDIVALAERYSIARIVVGLPLTLKGVHGASAASVLAFVEALRTVLDVPVETFDERFTSSIAEETMRRSGMKQSRRREKGKVDEIAAVILLQDYLRRASFQKEQSTGMDAV